jgi:hypothetical protein
MTSLFTVKHTSLNSPRLEQAEKMLAKVAESWGRMQTGVEAMAKTKMSDDERKAYFASVFPGDSTRAENTRRRMTELLDHESNRLEGMAGTLWQAYNAATFWIQHERPTRASDESLRSDLKEHSNLFGSGADMTEVALDRALELV